MSDHLIHADELPVWVPGETLVESRGLGWSGVSQRSFLYKGQDVLIPPMDDFMIVQYRQGLTPMDREFDGRWTRTQCGPGDFSLLSRAMQSHWSWTEGLHVAHIYLSNDLMARVARDICDGEIGVICLHDVLQGNDPVIGHIADQLTLEAAQSGAAGALYAEALSIQMAVHLLRHYASITQKPCERRHGFSQSEMKRLDEFIDAELAAGLTLERLAESLGLGVWALNLRLRRTIGKSPYAYVQEKRVAQASDLLCKSEMPIKAIAAACGFSDQAHMTRVLRKALGTTPAQLRKSAS
ncbi:helix-turn-helix domain-containing protein [Paracoccus sulfuroxidans]|uniref:AraC family transcriptional regulator n=1 Tax=Paracoccus sulfuroxidans TaxID=384678 RepID=A0A562NV57_9RHOB|nr:AraC family transcriptional regulator [Paracoccus sulfuroxidans]TWI35971.1 AraC family transcriptional regulator [Paracoccus sulfuroxidans]